MPNPAPRRVKLPPLADLVTLPEAMALTGHSKRTLHRLAAEGFITVYKVGSRRNHYSTVELQSLVRAGRTGSRSVRTARAGTEAAAS